MLSPIILFSNSTFAHDITTNVQVKPSLKITLPSSSLSEYLDPSITPFGSESITVTVATNNENGYKLYLNSNNTTRLTNTVDSTKYIDTLTSSTPGTSESFPVNSWGYRISNGNTGDSTITSTTNYFPFVSGKVISSSPIATNGVSSTLDFASKIDYTKPAGQYNIALNFKALPIVTQTYMQNMDPSVCTAEPTIVIDSRDEHPYTIQRLADGKCWMLDNLDLDLTDRAVVDNLVGKNNATGANTNATDTEIEYLKNGGRSHGDQYPTAGLEYHNWTGSGMEPVSPNSSFSQPLVNRSGKCDSTREGDSYPCTGVWKDASYTHNTVLDKVDANNTIIKDVANNIGGPGSYKIGTYYNYCAASAGTYCYGNGGSEGSPSGNTTSDICPAGWHIPSNVGGNIKDANYSGDYLALCSAIVGGDGCSGAWNDMSITASTSMQYQLSTPLSGFYRSGTAFRQGTYGRIWSSSYSSATNMGDITISSGGLFPSSSDIRFNGRSVRCVSS